MDVGDIAWARMRAADALGENWITWTSADLTTGGRRLRGRLFIGTRAFAFVADGPFPSDERIWTASYERLAPPTVRAPRLAPNAEYRFGDDLEIVGAKKRMKVLADAIAATQG